LDIIFPEDILFSCLKEGPSAKADLLILWILKWMYRYLVDCAYYRRAKLYHGYWPAWSKLHGVIEFGHWVGLGWVGLGDWVGLGSLQ
jgi:hypothetical protein